LRVRLQKIKDNFVFIRALEILVKDGALLMSAHWNFQQNKTEKSPFKFDFVSFAANFNNKSLTGGIVGGVLFFVVSIILSICAVKICNNRRRRRQERGENFP
jgi:uncharacterized protein (DUF2062 family)